MKKVLYTLFILCLVAFSMPLLLAIGVIVAITTGFPIIFRQKRIGKNGKIFTMYKFRTMVKNAEVLQKKYASMNEAHGPVFKLYNDPRYTRFGKFLAHTGLDELPQLYNVLAGDMALFGPRPLPVAEEKKLEAWQKKRKHIKPGIFSPWILEGYHATSFDAWMKSDIAYIKNKSFWYDTQLFIRMIAYMGSLIGHVIIDDIIYL
jgi:lipopolysaccharide/colanic/teichoic acid biosynthesis glycosyltransferase